MKLKPITTSVSARASVTHTTLLIVVVVVVAVVVSD